MSREPEEVGDREAQAATNESAAGDAVETAGETTAAATIGGAADTRPVGADTLVDVAGAPPPEEH